MHGSDPKRKGRPDSVENFGQVHQFVAGRRAPRSRVEEPGPCGNWLSELYVRRRRWSSLLTDHRVRQGRIRDDPIVGVDWVESCGVISGSRVAGMAWPFRPPKGISCPSSPQIEFRRLDLTNLNLLVVHESDTSKPGGRDRHDDRALVGQPPSRSEECPSTGLASKGSATDPRIPRAHVKAEPRPDRDRKGSRKWRSPPTGRLCKAPRNTVRLGHSGIHDVTGFFTPGGLASLGS
jgi:hypothetical protein